jgi:hypothetical protein
LKPAANETVGAGENTFPAIANPAPWGPTKIPVALVDAGELTEQLPPLQVPLICIVPVIAGEFENVQPLTQLPSV